MIRWIKNDFMCVREALGCLINRRIPFGIAILYYIIVGVLAAPLGIACWIYLIVWRKVTLRKLDKTFGKYTRDEEEA
jgi:hypothetical protein